MDTGQKTESIARLVSDIDKSSVVLPEFQRDFVWDVEKTFDLFDSFIKDIFVGSLIYGVPSFEITVRELDDRPRSGRGSRRKLRLNNFSRSEIDKLVKTSGFRLLLDGQQRATSLFRALKGIDPVYAVMYPQEELAPSVASEAIGKRTVEDSLKEITGAPVPGHVCVKVSDVFRMLNGEMPRENDKLQAFRESSPVDFQSDDEAMRSDEFNVYLTQSKNLENLFRQEKLVAYYLLDTDEEKFALFFERSNSKGIQLNFIDILAAKLYAGFNLRAKIEEFEQNYPAVPLHREAIVRAISFVVSGGKDTGRAFILTNLTYTHFNDYWEKMTDAYRRAYDYLFINRMLIHNGWMPYDNLVIPLMLFLRQIPGADFGQISDIQRRVLHTWYWLAIFSRRYSSAAQTLILDDAQNLEKVGRNDLTDVSAWLRKMQSSIREPEDLLGISKQYDAIYKGVLNLVHFTSGGLVNWTNGDRLSNESSLEDHHIFPRDFLRKSLEPQDADAAKQIDCIANRTLIPKLQNIRISNRSPSVYMADILGKNPRLEQALAAHMIPAEIIKGDYDDLYTIFIEDRAKRLTDLIRGITETQRDMLLKDLSA